MNNLRNVLAITSSALAAMFAWFVVCIPASAQSVPGPSMSIPEASSKRGFDWGLGLGFDYITNAKCNFLNKALACTSAESSAFSVSPSVMVQFDRLRLQVTVPYVDIEGPGTLSGALGSQTILAQSGSAQARRSGLGDVSVGGAFILVREGRIMPRFEIAGVVKLPTAAAGLGSDQIDYGAQITFYRPLFKGITTFGSLGYQRIGDPNTFRLHDGERATIGLDVNYSNWGGGALLEYNRSLFPGLPNSFMVDPYVSLPFIAGIGLQVYTRIPLDRSDPNREIGVRFVL